MRRVAALLVGVLLAAPLAPLCAAAATLDLTNATIVIEEPSSQRSIVYAQMLSDEVFKRVFVRWPVSLAAMTNGTVSGVPIRLSTLSTKEVDWGSKDAEGYRVAASAEGIKITGADQRGLLYVNTAYSLPQSTPNIPVKCPKYTPHSVSCW